MQKQLQAQIDTQNKILDLLSQHSRKTQTTPPTSISPSPIETQPPPTESLDMIGLSEFMDESTPGANKRDTTSPQRPMTQI